MEIANLEAALSLAKARLDEVLHPLVGRIDWAEFHSRSNVCLEAERALALAKHDEAALECPWEALWDSGAPLPHMVAGSGRVFLIYALKQSDPRWDGTYVGVVDPTDDYAFDLA